MKYDNFLGNISLNSPYQLIPGKNGSTIVLDENGFSYWNHKVNKDGTSNWRCSKRARDKCKATICISSQFIISQKNAHNHDPNPYVK